MAASHKGCLFDKTDYRKLRASLDNQVKNIQKIVINALAYIGETAVKTAREQGKYNDITGNLRSSIGYVILKDGKPVIGGNFEAVSVPQASTPSNAQMALYEPSRSEAMVQKGRSKGRSS